MKYRIGYKIKPKRVDGNIVLFTDGTNEIRPSEKACTDYGYIWDEGSGTCIVTRSDIKEITRKIDNTSNKIGGKQNTIHGNVQNSVVYGQKNRFEGNNKNVLVLGDSNLIGSGSYNSAIVAGTNNIIDTNVNNSAILAGNGAKTIRDSEVVSGGFSKSGLSSTISGNTNYTVQSIKVNMQQTVPSSTALVPLVSENGNAWLDVHPLSFVYMTAKCMATGDNLNKNSAGVLSATFSVGSNGVPLLVSSSFDQLAAGTSGFGSHTFYAANDVANKGIIIRARGKSGQTIVLSACVDLAEVIHGENTDIT